METYILLPESQYKKCFPVDDDSDLDSVEAVKTEATDVEPEQTTENVVVEENFRVPKRGHSPTEEISGRKKMKFNSGEKRADQFGLPTTKKIKATNGDLSLTKQDFNDEKQIPFSVTDFAPPRKVTKKNWNNNNTMYFDKIDNTPRDSSVTLPNPNPDSDQSHNAKKGKKLKCDCQQQPYNRKGFSRLHCICVDNKLQSGGWLTL